MKLSIKLTVLAISLAMLNGCAYWWRSYCTEVLNKDRIEVHGSIYDSNYKRIGTIDSH